MTAVVVDENVPMVANDAVLVDQRKKPQAPQADDKCRRSCIDALLTAVKSGVIVLDDTNEVMTKYRRHLSGSGQPGVGDLFLKHLSDNLYNAKKVRQTALVKTKGEFDAFPKGQALSSFDRDDRIFVALSMATPGKPPILNAVDSDYSHHLAALKSVGIKVKELCQHCLKVAAT
jgi:hypothetical protein